MKIKDFVSVFDNETHGAFTRTISLALRHGIPLQYVCEQLQKDKHSDMQSFSRVMIHPNVLKEAGIDPTVYTGFAWGNGIERMVMMRNQIEDIRHFESGNLKFLRQF
jgi:hypothetical protein